MADDDLQSLASYLGEKVKLLHILPLPNCTLESDANEMPINVEQSKSEDRNGRQSKGPKRDHITRPDAKSSSMSNGTASPAPDLFNGGSTLTNDKSAHVEVPKEWQLFVSFMRKQRETLMERLREWYVCKLYLRSRLIRKSIRIERNLLYSEPIIVIFHIMVL